MYFSKYISQNVFIKMYLSKCNSKNVFIKVYCLIMTVLGLAVQKSHKDCVTHSMWLTVCDSQCVRHSVLHTVCDSQCVTHSMWLTVCDTQCVTRSVWLAVCDTQCVYAGVLTLEHDRDWDSITRFYHTPLLISTCWKIMHGKYVQTEKGGK